MTGNKKSLTGQIVRLEKGDCADRANDRARPQYTHLPRIIKFQNFPARLRFSWRVDRNGCLRCLADKEVAR